MTDSCNTYDRNNAYQIYRTKYDNYIHFRKQRSAAYEDTFTKVYDAVYGVVYDAYSRCGIEDNDECVIANDIAKATAGKVWDSYTLDVDASHHLAVKAYDVYSDLCK